MTTISGPPIVVSACEIEGRLVVEVSGDLDIATVPLLEELVISGRSKGGVTLDLSEVRFIDAVGIRCLLHCRDVAGGLVLRSPSDVVRRLLLLTRTLDEFAVDEAEPTL